MILVCLVSVTRTSYYCGNSFGGRACSHPASLPGEEKVLGGVCLGLDFQVFPYNVSVDCELRYLLGALHEKRGKGTNESS